MIRNRSWLILSLIAGQAILLAAGLIFFALQVRRSMWHAHAAQVLTSNAGLAREFARSSLITDADSLEPGTPGWRSLQTAVERIRLPNSGFICIIDDAGRILCHPDLGPQPELSDVNLAAVDLVDDDGAVLGTLVDVADRLPLGQAAQGVLSLPDGAQYVGVARTSRHELRVLVHQDEAALVAAVDRFTNRMLLIGAPIAVAVLLCSGAATWLITRRFRSRLEEINAGLEDEVRRRTAELRTTRDAVVFGLARLSESRDADTGQHLNRIRAYAKVLARRLRETKPELAATISDEWINDLAISSVLHDIGKVGVPDRVLLKPGKLTEEEFEQIKKHTYVGGDTLYAIERRLGASNFLTLAREIAFAHHERWDGEGYPFGLEGDIIPLSARIVALADVYDALTSRRPYKDALPHDKAVEIICEGRGAHFDADVVDAFLSGHEQFDDLRGRLQDDDSPHLMQDIV